MPGNVSMGMPVGNTSAGYVSQKGHTANGKSMVMHFETSGGKKGTLQWDREMLASVGGTGGTVNAGYHESSTAEDPVAMIWGTDSRGQEYRDIVHLNAVDPRKATPAEMIALNAHLAKVNGSNAENPIALWASKSAGVDTAMDYEQYYNEYIAMQRQSGDHSGAGLYQLQLERFLFFHQQHQKDR